MCYRDAVLNFYAIDAINTSDEVICIFFNISYKQFNGSVISMSSTRQTQYARSNSFLFLKINTAFSLSSIEENRQAPVVHQ